MMDETFVNAIAQLEGGRTQKINLGGTDMLVYNGMVVGTELIKKPVPDALVVHTLTGLVDFLTENRDELNLERLAVHVVSPVRVDAVSPTDEKTQQRFLHLKAECYDRFAAVSGFKFGQYMSAEAMIIAMMALFEDNPDRKAVINLLSNVEQGVVRTDEDDGVSQVVTVRDGISMKADRRVPNPVTLIPHRTFVEIQQPASEFIFRTKSSGAADTPGAALFEADGGAWRDEATRLIRQWLMTNLPDGVAILA